MPSVTLPRTSGTALAIAGGLVALAVAASSTDASARTTRGVFDRPPYYDGRVSGLATRAAHVAVSFRDEPGSLDPTPSTSPSLAGLLDSLRVELDRLGLTRPLPGGDRPMRDGPSVRFGARRGGTAQDGVPLAPDEIDPREPRRMTFEIEGPGRAWKDHVGRAAGDSVPAIVVVQLGFSEQWVRQTSWKGGKSIELGTGRSMLVPWLTSLDDPVQVLQLTGVVLTPSGKVLRVGAEGLMARRTGMTASVLGAQEVLTEKELAPLVTPAEGATPPWREALRSLVSRLLAGTAR